MPSWCITKHNIIQIDGLPYTDCCYILLRTNINTTPQYHVFFHIFDSESQEEVQIVEVSNIL